MLCLVVALVCALPSWAVLVTAENEEASKALGASIAPLCFGAGFDSAGIRYRAGGGSLVYQDEARNECVIVTSTHVTYPDVFVRMQYGFGPSYHAGLNAGQVLNAKFIINHPSRDVSLVWLDGVAREEDGTLIEPIEFYDEELYGYLAEGMIILFAGTGENGDPSLGGPSGSGVRDGYARAARGQLARLGIAGVNPTIWFMKYFSSLTVGGIGAPGDSGGPAMVELEGKLLMCGIIDMGLDTGINTWTGFEYFGYLGPADSTGQTVFEWIVETIAADTGNGSEGEEQLHAADTDGNWQIDLSELLRVIQFFNMGGYHCAGGEDSEDGFMPGVNADNQTCPAHASDYAPQDWSLSLSELLRTIQFFNTGGYHPCPEGEDGYCPRQAEAA